MKKIALLLISALTAATALAAGPTPEAKALIKAEMVKAAHVTPADLKTELESGKDIVLIDIRQKSERPIMGLITKDDLHIPRGFLEIRAYGKVPDRNAEIVTYCGKGIRSAFATNTLANMGYKNVRNLKGGARAWKQAGFPTLQP